LKYFVKDFKEMLYQKRSAIRFSLQGVESLGGHFATAMLGV
jgi:hypothetical protein